MFDYRASKTFDIQPGEWVPIDGKSQRNCQADSANQNFVSVVSVYSSQFGVVLVSQQFAAKQTSELTVVQNLCGEGGLPGRCIALSKNGATDC